MDDEALFSLARGELAPSELARVEAHLRDCSDCRAVLGEAARSLAPATSQGASAGDAPARIARYEVRALIGAGASGVVYRAFDPDLQRTVAIKVLRPDLHGSPELSARMLREAQAMARLSDPYVVAVYDVGMTDGAVYLVMEYIEGHTLAEWLRDAPRTPDQILKAFRDAGRGLLAAHEKGLVHLDFKPENVLVATDGRALVTDFGLAREAERRPASTGLDGAGPAELYAPTRGLVGTPAYMAPELFEGGRATASSDQFAFCVALFTALFARHPFGAGEGITLEELIAKMNGGVIESPLTLRSRQSDRLLAVISRGLATDPTLRFADLSGLLSAIDHAARAPLQRKVWLIGTASALLLIAWLVVSKLTAPVPSAPVRVTKALPAASPTAPAIGRAQQPETDASTDQDAADVGPLPTEDAQAKKARAQPSSRRRPPPKKREVRYRDWLKDPF